MELRQLQYFNTIAHVGGFRRAAHQLGVSQTTLSQQIRLLERELHAELFERSRRQISLTLSGTLFLERSERILAALRVACDEVPGARRRRARPPEHRRDYPQSVALDAASAGRVQAPPPEH